MGDQLINSIPVTCKFWAVLLFVLILCISKHVIAQPGDIVDSLITVKKEFTGNEKIEFTVKLQNHAKRKPYHVRHVPTMSCSCGNKDFYYELYSILDVKNPFSRKAFFIYNEKTDAKRCLCKSGYAEFYDNKKFQIPAINQSGNYMLIIRGYGFIMYSNVFIVTN